MPLSGLCPQRCCVPAGSRPVLHAAPLGRLAPWPSCSGLYIYVFLVKSILVPLAGRLSICRCGSKSRALRAPALATRSPAAPTDPSLRTAHRRWKHGPPQPGGAAALPGTAWASLLAAGGAAASASAREPPALQGARVPSSTAACGAVAPAPLRGARCDRWSRMRPSQAVASEKTACRG